MTTSSLIQFIKAGDFKLVCLVSISNVPIGVTIYREIGRLPGIAARWISSGHNSTASLLLADAVIVLDKESKDWVDRTYREIRAENRTVVSFGF